jgi:hypothetical protein
LYLAGPCCELFCSLSCPASMLAVDFGAVRYSPTEGTHYFYDPSFPSIQFLLSGRWEAWDVGWVK